MDDILESEMGNMLNPIPVDKQRESDSLRKNIGVSSLIAKLRSACTMIIAAEECLDPVEFKKNPYSQTEAVFAATEEVRRTIELIQTLCVRLSGHQSIPPLNAFTEAIANGGPVSTQISAVK